MGQNFFPSEIGAENFFQIIHTPLLDHLMVAPLFANKFINLTARLATAGHKCAVYICV